MQNLVLGGVIVFSMMSTAVSAAPILQPGGSVVSADHLWLAKNDKAGEKRLKNAKEKGGKEKGKGKADRGKPDHATGKPAKGPGKKSGNGGDAPGQSASDAPGRSGKSKADKPAKASDRRAFSDSADHEAMRRLVDVVAPDGRDMARVLGATGLIYATPDLVVSDVAGEELITYLNCPPGLAKKDPPCVPPGLAKKGVTSDEWLSYEEDEYDELWRERRRVLLESDRPSDADLLLLRSDQIATLFDLPPAPEGQRYALIDGMPVLLDEEDYTSLLLVRDLAGLPELGDGLRIAPTAALTQEELVRLYRLPQPGPDENYAVLNGQLLRLSDAEYEILQLIRIARAFL